jgi:transcriptional regulator with XRE-family HTH domain/Zn-dependent peptidase ImmA (M78 family)
MSTERRATESDLREPLHSHFVQMEERKVVLRFWICKIIWLGESQHRMTDVQIGRRLRALREGKHMTQESLAKVLGLNDRQSISQIENGQRRLSASELVTVVHHFDVTIDTMTNPFLLSNKSSFSWRQHHVPSAELDQFELRAGEWIGAYRELNRLSDVRLKKLLPHLDGLTHKSPFEHAVEVGEDVAEELNLGDKPALRLAEVLQDRLGMLILMVDALPGISGAACRLPELNAVLINRSETAARRNSDLAHEFFHILTWDVMKPERVESSDESWDQPRTRSHERNQRIEQLADNFASGLLMPSAVLDALGEPHGDLVDWLAAAAAELGVSSRALKWRLVNAGRSAAVGRIANQDLSNAARTRLPPPPPLPFSKAFIETIARAIEAGHLSSRRASTLLGLGVEEVGELCDSYEITRPVEL